ncbi:MAG: histidinol-phosphate transaminase [Anaerolineales bacterium]|jgi:histidinol-phosphate aminotransferase|nr:histidinol-phosphate transaminase [Anaerolineales bacterium]
MIKLPPHITRLPPYTPIEPFDVLSQKVGRAPVDIIKLDANENPYGMSPRAREALASLAYGHIYPDPESRALRAGLSSFSGAPAENLLVGAGADELIDLIMRVTLSPGEVLLNCPPTFGMYTFDADLNNARVINVTRNADFSLDLNGILEAAQKFSPKLIFVTSPNNPDGSLLPLPVLQKLLTLPALIVLDEAYIEFSGAKSQISNVPITNNLIVLRTFSKLAGLAGLRVGYGGFPSWLMPTLWKAKQPYNVNVAASAAALASLEDRAYLDWTVKTLAAERERLAAGLAAFNFLTVYPSSANFILCRVAPQVDAAQLQADLAQKHGIFIRYFNKPGLTDCIRISVGKPEQTDALLKAIGDW